MRRWLCLSRSISRASVWSSLVSAATSTTVVWTTSAPSEWRVERESHSLYACKSLWTADCVCVWVCVYVIVFLWYKVREWGTHYQTCHHEGHCILHAGSTHQGSNGGWKGVFYFKDIQSAFTISGFKGCYTSLIIHSLRPHEGFYFYSLPCTFFFSLLVCEGQCQDLSDKDDAFRKNYLFRVALKKWYHLPVLL